VPECVVDLPEAVEVDEENREGVLLRRAGDRQTESFEEVRSVRQACQLVVEGLLMIRDLSLDASGPRMSNGTGERTMRSPSGQRHPKLECACGPLDRFVGLSDQAAPPSCRPTGA
jgi:hypothetical protein